VIREEHFPALPIGINLDGVLVHDGLPLPHAATRFAWVRHSRAFDYIEKNIDPGEDFAPYFGLVERYGVPIKVFGGIFCAGLDEPRMRWGIATGGRLGARIFNCQLYSRHADGRPVSDQGVADFFIDAMTHGTPVHCLPSLEVHVDMWSEAFHRVERVANLLARSNVTLRITLDHSHLVFKLGHPKELAISGIGNDAEGHALLDPRSPNSFDKLWLREGWVAHAHTRSVAPAGPLNTRTRRDNGQPGRAIQYPFVAAPEGSFGAAWQAEQIEPWKLAVRQMLAWKAAHPECPLERVSCEFIPFTDYGGRARYSIWENNLACAAWLREEWAALQRTTFNTSGTEALPA
jgi:hypothetical protein